MKWITVKIQGKDISIAFDETSVHVYNAFLIKDDLKLRGYRWNPADKSWFTNAADIAEEIEVLKNNLQPSGQPEDNQPAIPFAAKPVDMPEKYPASYSVLQLRQQLDQIIQQMFPQSIWIRGIIASAVKQYTWAAYFDLKDEKEGSDLYFRLEIRKSYLEIINQKLAAAGIADSLEKDLPVFLHAEVRISSRQAVDLRLSVTDILPEYTQSKIRNLREITIERLTAEVLVQKQKQLKLPRLLNTLGLITSEQGTSVKDIFAGLSPYHHKYRFLFLDSRMEGSHAVQSIIHAIDLLEKHSNPAPQAILIARGGGSEQSLSVFNDYQLCKRICQSSIPILTAIGHEKDLSAAELCAYFTPTPATPSGLGHYLRELYAELSAQLSNHLQFIISHFSSIHGNEQEKIKSLLQNVFRQTKITFSQQQKGLKISLKQMETLMNYKNRQEKNRLRAYIRQIRQIIPGKINFRRQFLVKIALENQQRLNSKHFLYYEIFRKLLGKIDFQGAVYRMNHSYHELHTILNRVTEQINKKIENSKKDIQAKTDLINAHNPENILKKGFTLTLNDAGEIIKSMKDFNAEQGVKIKFADGITPRLKKETP